MSDEIYGILAIDQNNGIGLNKSLPWHIPEELKLFKKKTLPIKNLLFGNSTTFPNLPDRNIYIFSSTSHAFNTPQKVLQNIPKPFCVCGGAKTIIQFIPYITTFYLSILKTSYTCDTFIPFEIFYDFTIVEKIDYPEFTYYTLKKNISPDTQYLNLLQKVLSTGELKQSRNSQTLSCFNSTLHFSLLNNQFPLLTTKKMFLTGIIHELLFFLSGETDTTILSKKGVKIWEGNTSEQFLKSHNLPYPPGEMGPMYGYQFRNFGKPFKLNSQNHQDQKINYPDQLQNIINLILTDPFSRRILLTSFNPLQADEGVLYPCHSIVLQFNVSSCLTYLDLFCYNRSQDLFLGTPWNIASTSLLLILIAKITNKIPRNFYLTLGDTHIYTSHISQVKTQLKNIPYSYPTLTISKSLTSIQDILNLTPSDFILSNYQSHPIIKAEMIP